MFKRSNRRFAAFLLAAVAAAYILFYWPMPYYIFQPGSADEVKPMVHVKKGFAEEKGALMLTTVRLTHSNFVTYVYALIHPYAELVSKDKLLRGGESEEEYTERQEIVMVTSQSNAIRAAYKKAGIPYHIKSEGVVVEQVLKEMPAAKVLEAGDRIVKMDHTAIRRVQDLYDFIGNKKVGDRVTVTYVRKDRENSAELVLSALPNDQSGADRNKKPRAGIGIVPSELQSVQADNPDHQVEIKAGDIGGPSAGLMFALEVYNQLVPEDITKGYRIAGTGEIDPEGRVSVIGGIRHKIVAADRAKADIFFAPKDWYPPEGVKLAPIKNTTDAIDQAKKIGTNMKIVSVGTIDDALNYLAGLPPKR